MAAPRHKAEDEQEVKIKLGRKDLEKVFNAVSKKYAPGYVDHKYMPRAYYDTPDLQLFKNAISVRMQYKEGKNGTIGGYEQTVKFDLSGGGTLAKGALLRREIKDKTPDHEPDLALVKESKAKAALKPFVGKRLKHVFTAAIERRYYEVEVGKGKHKGTVEVAFDVGEIILPHNGRHYSFYEIELERKGGSPDAVDALREEILKMAKSAKIQPLSKSQQGSKQYLKTQARKKAPPSAP